MKTDYSAKDKPIYLFRINTETKQIEKFEITEYSERPYKTGSYYRMKMPMKFPSVYRTTDSDKFDKFLNHCLISFNPDLNAAISIMKGDNDKKIEKVNKTLNALTEIKDVLDNERSNN